MPDLVDRARPPANATDAVDLLLRICPEFGPAWSSLRELMGEEPAISVGISNVFGQIVLPFLLYALDGDTGSDFHIPYLGCAADVGDAHRRAFRDEAQWAAMPARGTRQLEDLVGRLYAVLDLWAATDDRSLRDALYVEMAETGYVDLSSEVLLGHAGNNLRALAGLAQQSAVDDQPRQA